MTLRFGDLLTIFIYFLLTMGIGFWFMRKNRSTDDYFVGGRALPGWAIGMSLLGTAISSVSFLAYPGNAYKADWSLIWPGLMLPFAAILAIWVFVPFYRNSRFTSAYEYLEGRFSPGVRLYGVFMYVVQQVWRLGSVLYLLSIPIQAMTGWDQMNVILGVGICTTIYCFVGGLEAVVWTDVLQTFVLLMGGLGCVITVFLWDGVGPSVVIQEAVANNKFNLIPDSDFDLTKMTIWVLILWGLAQNIQEHVSDQIKVQRYCAADSLAAARRAVLFNGLMCIPVWCLFMFVGTCLYAFYLHVPDANVATMESDKVFPYFIISYLPVGVSGLVIAGVMAAAMSTLSSSMNAVSTVLTVDIYKQYLGIGKDDMHYLNVGRAFTVVGGVLMIVTALPLVSAGMDTFLPLSFFISSATVGGLGGIFLVGFFSKRVNTPGIYLGIVTCVVATVYLTLSGIELESLEGSRPSVVAFFTWFEPYKSPTHNYLIGVFANIASFVVGYFGSFLFPSPTEAKLRKATYWTLEPVEEGASD